MKSSSWQAAHPLTPETRQMLLCPSFVWKTNPTVANYCFVHFTHQLNPMHGHKVAGVYSGCYWARSTARPGDVTSPWPTDKRENPQTITKDSPLWSISNLSAKLACLFLNWEEAGAPQKNPCWHGENIQTPHKEAPAEIWNRNLLAKRWRANHQTTARPLLLPWKSPIAGRLLYQNKMFGCAATKYTCYFNVVFIGAQNKSAATGGAFPLVTNQTKTQGTHFWFCLCHVFTSLCEWRITSVYPWIIYIHSGSNKGQR